MERLTIKIVRIGFGNSDIPLPRYMSDHASGMDLHAAIAKDITLNPGERKRIPTGIALAIPPGYEAQIRPRSGLALQKGITLINSPGTIDADYRGEVGIILINHGESPFPIKRGERLAQMVISKVYRAELQVEETLDPTERNAGGFGHTGV